MNGALLRFHWNHLLDLCSRVYLYITNAHNTVYSRRATPNSIFTQDSPRWTHNKGVMWRKCVTSVFDNTR